MTVIIKRSWIWLAIAILACATVFYLTASSYGTFMSTDKIFLKIFPEKLMADQVNYYVRKAAHIIIFGLIALAVQRTLKGKKFSYLIAWIFTVAYGASDEWHQIFVPNRTPKLTDLMLDSIGALLALGLMYLLILVKNRKSNLPEKTQRKM